jgi:hypothetical protein
LVTLASACGGGQTTEPNDWHGDIPCSEDPAWATVDDREVRERAVERIEGEYSAPFYWLAAETRLPTAPDDATVESTTGLQLSQRYVGTDTPSRRCTGSLLLPFVTTLHTDDGKLNAEFLTLAEVHANGSIERAWGMEGWVPISKSAPAGKQVVQSRAILVNDSSAALPTWDQYLKTADADTRACSSNASDLTLGSRDAGLGRLCLPGLGLGLWPEACGGIELLPADAPAEGDTSFVEAVSAVGNLELISDPIAHLSVIVSPVGKNVCHVRSVSPVPDEPLPSGVALVRQPDIVVGSVHLSGQFGSDLLEASGSAELNAVASATSLRVWGPICFEVRDAAALTQAARLTLAQPSYQVTTGCEASERELCESSAARYRLFEAAVRSGFSSGTLCLGGSLDDDPPSPTFTAMDTAGNTHTWTYQWSIIDSN